LPPFIHSPSTRLGLPVPTGRADMSTGSPRTASDHQRIQQ
jgi:hypothetical protein